MKIEDSKYRFLEHKKIITSYGNFYFFKTFIVSELDEGIHFGWDKVSKLVEDIYNYYGENFKIVYISNRIHSYSIEPQTWINLRREGHDFVIASAIIVYDELNYNIAKLEKKFFGRGQKRCFSLDEAIKWVNTLDEFKKVK